MIKNVYVLNIKKGNTLQPSLCFQVQPIVLTKLLQGNYNYENNSFFCLRDAAGKQKSTGDPDFQHGHPENKNCEVFFFVLGNSLTG